MIVLPIQLTQSYLQHLPNFHHQRNLREKQELHTWMKRKKLGMGYMHCYHPSGSHPTHPPT